MNMMTAKIGGKSAAEMRRIAGKAPLMLCPTCGHNAVTRTSEEMSVTARKLYYRCSNVLCGMSWTAMLTVENVITPSALGGEYRKEVFRDDKPPGHAFGQMSIFEKLG